MDVVNGRGILVFDGEAVIRVLLVAQYCYTAKPCCRLPYVCFGGATQQHQSQHWFAGWRKIRIGGRTTTKLIALVVYS